MKPTNLQCIYVFLCNSIFMTYSYPLPYSIRYIYLPWKISDWAFKPDLSHAEGNWPLNRESHLADCEDALKNLSFIPLQTEYLCVCVHACGLINCISSHFVFILMRFHFSPLFTKNLSKLINSVSLGRNPSIFRTPNWIDLRGPHLAFSIGAICARFPLWINMKKWQHVLLLLTVTRRACLRQCLALPFSCVTWFHRFHCRWLIHHPPMEVFSYVVQMTYYFFLTTIN